MKNFTDLLGKEYLFFDGGTGSVLQKMGLKPGELPEMWNITHSNEIVSLHASYFLSGSNIVNTNTFGANSLKFGEKLPEIISAAVENAQWAKKMVEENSPLLPKIQRTRAFDPVKAPHFVALDIGPCGKLLKPLGDLDFEDCVRLFTEVATLGLQAGVDLVLVETMNDCYETKACIVGIKEAMEKTGIEIPIIASNVYDADGRLLTGSTATEMAAILEGLGVSALGMNCSLGPIQMKEIIPSLVSQTSLPILVKPNAGLPKSVNGVTMYDVDEALFASTMKEMAEMGVHVLGGCCGTNPDYIRNLVDTVYSLPFTAPAEKNSCVVCSNTKSVKIGQMPIYGHQKPVLIGERINPTGKKKLKDALRNKDMGYILNEALTQQEKGAHILDVNVGLPEINETEMMVAVIKELQTVTDLPLQIDTSNVEAMEKALRIYNGKALINSVNGKEEVMNQIFPLIKKYGGVVVALTLDETGIPETSEGRIRIAEKIYKKATDFGIDKKNIIIDPLAMAVSSDQKSPKATLESVSYITHKLQGNTILGVSNISFGLPCREVITSAFFTMAMENGLSAAIMNPSSLEMQKAYYSYCTLRGFDDNCLNYIQFIEDWKVDTSSAKVVSPATSPQKDVSNSSSSDSTVDLLFAITKGLKEKAADLTARLLETVPPMAIVENHLIPALDTVGKAFEQKKIYLPQLLMSAEAASFAFEVIKAELAKTNTVQIKKGPIILATVEGDIHDIGKNIVKVILENYGYEVIDLGKDVPPSVVVETCEKNHIELVGLSALMTTTVPAMEETIKLLRQKCPHAKVCVGGAVLTPEYAQMIGADFYGKDAMETVSYAKKIFA